MNYAKSTENGIQSGTFESLWPNTSTPGQGAFAARNGYSPVLTILPINPVTETLQDCPVYSLNDAFYSVKVVSLALSDVQACILPIVQKRLDDFASTRGYDNILSACTYVTSSVDQFRLDAETAVSLRDQTWAACYGILSAIQSGDKQMPSLEDFLNSLPPLVWPVARPSS